jgi:hypothetical protein
MIKMLTTLLPPTTGRATLEPLNVAGVLALVVLGSAVFSTLSLMIACFAFVALRVAIATRLYPRLVE